MNQKARRIGQGMKPRASEEAILPTAEGREEPSSDPTQEHVPAVIEGGDLESVSAEQPEEVSEPEAEKELELHATEVPVVPGEAFDALAAVMKASEGVSGADPVQKLEPPKTIVDVGQEFPVTSKDGSTTIYKIPTPYQPEPPKAEDFIITKSGRRKLAEAELGLGELPTGEYRHTVRIAESYVEGAKQQAEADNMNLEDWLTQQLNCYLEQWWFAAGPKS